MLARAQQAGVLSDGHRRRCLRADRTFREWLATQGMPFVLAIRSNDTVLAVGGRPRLARSLITQVPAGAGQRRARSARPRLFEWATVELDPAGLLDQWGALAADPLPDHHRPHHPNRITGGLAFYRCAGPSPTPVAKLVRVAGTRWASEECFQTAKDEAAPALASRL